MKKPSPAQIRARMNNACLRSLGGARMMFLKSGHYDFQKKIEDLEAQFKAKVKTHAS